MMSNLGKQFLTELILNGFRLERQILQLDYSERITVAFDLRVLIKKLVKDVENQTGENLQVAILEEK